MDYFQLYQDNTFHIRKDLSDEEKQSLFIIARDLAREKTTIPHPLPNCPPVGTYYMYLPMTKQNLERNHMPFLRDDFFNQLEDEHAVFYGDLFSGPQFSLSDDPRVYVQVAFLSRVVANPLFDPTHRSFSSDVYSSRHAVPQFQPSFTFYPGKPSPSSSPEVFGNLFSPPDSFNTNVVHLVSLSELQRFRPYLDKDIGDPHLSSANINGITTL